MCLSHREDVSTERLETPWDMLCDSYARAMHMGARVFFVLDPLSSSVNFTLAKRQLPLQFSRSLILMAWPFVRLSGCMWRWMRKRRRKNTHTHTHTHPHSHETHAHTAHTARTHTLVNNPAGSTSAFLYRWIKKDTELYRDINTHFGQDDTDDISATVNQTSVCCRPA